MAQHFSTDPKGGQGAVLTCLLFPLFTVPGQTYMKRVLRVCGFDLLARSELRRLNNRMRYTSAGRGKGQRSASNWTMDRAVLAKSKMKSKESSNSKSGKLNESFQALSFVNTRCTKLMHVTHTWKAEGSGEQMCRFPHHLVLII